MKLFHFPKNSPESTQILQERMRLLFQMRALVEVQEVKLLKDLAAGATVEPGEYRYDLLTGRVQRAKRVCDPANPCADCPSRGGNNGFVKLG